jgi:hypothetical protein
MEDFRANEFLAMSPAERVRKCRAMADEAARLALEASEDLKPLYAHLARECAITAELLEAQVMRRRLA